MRARRVRRWCDQRADCSGVCHGALRCGWDRRCPGSTEPLKGWSSHAPPRSRSSTGLTTPRRPVAQRPTIRFLPDGGWSPLSFGALTIGGLADTCVIALPRGITCWPSTVPPPGGGSNDTDATTPRRDGALPTKWIRAAIEKVRSPRCRFVSGAADESGLTLGGRHLASAIRERRAWALAPRDISNRVTRWANPT
jgi:hypothetical protein